jgi:hypothetical protein
MSNEFSFQDCNEEQLWRFVASHLASQGIGVVLVGGAVVAIYSEGAYRSGDLDFVQEHLFGENLESAMRDIGFERRGRHFEHPDCSHLFIEFVSGPLGIGSDTQIAPKEVEERDQVLKILSPTDCVRDRLAGYIFWEARECLDQAVLVANNQSVNWEIVEKWCRDEGPTGIAAFENLKRLCGQ